MGNGMNVPPFSNPVRMGITDASAQNETRAMQQHVADQFVGNRQLTRKAAYDWLPDNRQEDHGVRYEFDGGLVVREKMDSADNRLFYEIFPDGNTASTSGPYEDWYTVESDGRWDRGSQVNDRALGDGMFTQTRFYEEAGTVKKDHTEIGY